MIEIYVKEKFSPVTFKASSLFWLKSDALFDTYLLKMVIYYKWHGIQMYQPTIAKNLDTILACAIKVEFMP
jgi:hypothetical protein